MEKTKRIPNLDLLRIVAMIMIVAMHYFGYGQIREVVRFPQFSYFFVWIPEIACRVGVNCYIIITSWFMVEHRFKLGKLIYLWFEIVFINIVCFAFSATVLKNAYTIRDIIDVFTPIVSKEYWYMSAYFVFYLISPLLIWIVKNIDADGLKKISFGAILIFTIIPFDWTKLDYGYHFVWFIVLFFITAFIKVSEENSVYNKRPIFYLVMFSCVLVICFVLKFVFDIIGKRIGFDSFGSHFIEYNSFLIVVNSFALFMLFKNLSIRKKVFSKIVIGIAPLTLGVYLIHLNVYIDDWIWQKVVNPLKYIDTLWIIIHFIVCVIGVFTVCILLSYVFTSLLKALRINKISFKIGCFIESKLKSYIK